MAIFEEYCRFCLKVAIDEHFEEMKDIKWDILDFPLLKVNSGEGNKHVMCKQCSRKVMEAYTFKSMCLCTDNTIIPYIDCETGCSVDLREIYVKEMINNQPIGKLDDLKICRLCMQPIMDNNFTPVHEIDVDMIDKYIPEINFSLVEDPIICKQCVDSIYSHGSFITNCLPVEDNIKGCSGKNVLYRPLGVSLNSCKIDIIKSEEVEEEEALTETVVKSESGNEDGVIKMESIDIKLEDTDTESDSPWPEYEEAIKNKTKMSRDTCNITFEAPLNAPSCENKYRKMVNICLNGEEESPEWKKFKCYGSEHRSICRQNFSECQTVCKDTSEVRLYKCNECDYQSKDRSIFRIHLVKHKNPSKVQMYKCDACDYQSLYKHYLKQHQLKHKNPSEIQMYNCGICNYQAKRKEHLTAHQLIHKDPSELQMYKCDKCNFESKTKRALNFHLRKHNDPSEIQMYKCDICNYKSEYKETLNRHRLVHKDPSEIQMYKCDICNFATKHKGALHRHQLVHKDPSKIQMYKCDVCNFEAKRKSYLNIHLRKHKNPSEIQMYKCDVCNFQYDRKDALNRHRLVHKDPSETQMYKCDVCDFATKHRAALPRHQLIHKDPSNLQLYKCDACNYASKYKSGLKIHMLRRHKGNV